LIDLQITGLEAKPFLSSLALLRAGKLFPHKFYLILIDDNLYCPLRGLINQSQKLSSYVRLFKQAEYRCVI